EGLLPPFGDIDRKVPSLGRAGLVAAQLAIGFAHGAVQGVPVDGGGAGVDPEPGRWVEKCKNLVQEAGAFDTRVVNGSPVCSVIAAIHAPSGEIDADVALGEIRNPRAWRDAVQKTTRHGAGCGLRLNTVTAWPCE